MTQNVRYHGTITAIRETKSGHTILQVNKTEELVLISIDEHTDQTIRVFDNILFEKVPAPMTFYIKVKGQKKPAPVTFNKAGVKIITIQMSDLTLNRLRRVRGRSAPPVINKPRASAVDQAELIPIKGA